MKFWLICALSVLISCNTEKKDQVVANDKNADTLKNLNAISGDSDQINSESEIVAPDSILLWQVDDESRKELFDDTTNRRFLTPDRILNGIKKAYPNVPAKIVAQKGDTLVIGFDDGGEQLSQRMGSTGSSVYVQMLAVNFFELPYINYIRLDMEEGDHAGPELLSREVLKEIRQ
jgi:hypothetical protein